MNYTCKITLFLGTTINLCIINSCMVWFLFYWDLRISQHLFVRNKSIAPIFSKVISWYFWVQNFNHFGTFKPTLEEVRKQIPLSILNLRITNRLHSRYRSMVCGVSLMMFIFFKLQSYWHNISFNICLVSFFSLYHVIMNVVTSLR